MAARRRHILVVEDDPVIGMMLQDMLQQLDFHPVGPAGSVAAALKLLVETPKVHAALLDCNLGRESVWPVADQLRRQDIPFVFSTGYGAAGVEPRFADAPVLSKPFPIASLERALMPLLGDGT